jgi:hypothetical protein
VRESRVVVDVLLFALRSWEKEQPKRGFFFFEAVCTTRSGCRTRPLFRAFLVPDTIPPARPLNNPSRDRREGYSYQFFKLENTVMHGQKERETFFHYIKSTKAPFRARITESRETKTRVVVVVRQI